MATLAQGRAPATPYAGILAHAGGAWLKNVANAVRSYFLYRSSMEQLSKLSDRQLDDIGLVRADISTLWQDEQAELLRAISPRIFR